MYTCIFFTTVVATTVTMCVGEYMNATVLNWIPASLVMGVDVRLGTKAHLPVAKFIQIPFPHYNVKIHV